MRVLACVCVCFFSLYVVCAPRIGSSIIIFIFATGASLIVVILNFT